MNDQLQWQQHGGSGPCLLLVHGFLSSRSQWMLNLAELATFCRPITVELFGHAHSPSPTDEACYRPEYYLQCFEHIREQLKIEQWFVLGYSLGAALTLRYAIDHPDRVFGHLFTNSISGLADEAQRALWRESAAGIAAGVRKTGQTAMVKIPVHPKHAWKLPAPVHRALVADALLHDPVGIANTLEITNPDASVRSLIHQNVQPVCLIQGTREKRFEPFAEFAAANMPDLQVVRIDAGHGMNMTAPTAFNTAVYEFIQQFTPQCPTS